MRTRQILKLASALWTVLDHPEVHPTNKDTVTTSLKQQGRDVMALPEGEWDAHKNRQHAPRLLPQRG